MGLWVSAPPKVINEFTQLISVLHVSWDSMNLKAERHIRRPPNFILTPERYMYLIAGFILQTKQNCITKEISYLPHFTKY